MKVLVTGGAGFIGSNFVRYWRKKHLKDKIVVLDLLTYAGHLENLQGFSEDPNYEFIKGDIRESKSVVYAMKGVDIVVHFAAESHVDRSIAAPGDFITTNVEGTYILLEAAKNIGVKLFHHVSTDEVFGALPIDRPEIKFNEETSYNPHSPYSATKAASDHLVRAYHDTYKLPVTITNTSNNYGPYQDPEKLIPRFITNLLLDKKVPLMGKGENVRDWIHVYDQARAIESVINAALNGRKDVLGETFCVGGNSERTNREVTESLLSELSKDDSYIEYIPHRLGHDSRYAIDSTKIKDILGWEPEYNFKEGLSQTVEWYKQNEWWWKPFKK